MPNARRALPAHGCPPGSPHRPFATGTHHITEGATNMENGTVHNGSKNGVHADAIPASPHDLLWGSLPPKVIEGLKQPLDPGLVSHRKGRKGGTCPVRRGKHGHRPSEPDLRPRRLVLRACRRGHAVADRARGLGEPVGRLAGGRPSGALRRDAGLRPGAVPRPRTEGER